MGMDFRFNGSAGYDNFDRMIRRIAEGFGAKVIDAKNFPKPGIIHWFGTTDWESPADKFTWPEDANQLVRQFCEHPYDSLSREQTEELRDIIGTVFTEETEKAREEYFHNLGYPGCMCDDDDVWQILEELDLCIENEVGWKPSI